MKPFAGNTPTSDEEAISRILDPADAIIAQRGSTTRNTDVARSLGVTSQTVYRYFPASKRSWSHLPAVRRGFGVNDQSRSATED